jgi:hypothetical protein
VVWTAYAQPGLPRPVIALVVIVDQPGEMWERETAVAAAEQWMAGYIHAWETNEPDDIRALFTRDAEYRDGPSTPPWLGHDAIVAGWLAQKDESGTWSFHHEVVAVDGNVAIVRGRTSYPKATEKSRLYDNLMVIRLDEQGRARSFTDWFVASEAPEPDA